MNEEIIVAQPDKEDTPVFPLKGEENDNSADSPTVDETEDEKETDTDSPQSQEGDDNSGDDDDKGDGDDDADKENLNDHPRWKEREDDWTKKFNKQEERHTEEIGKLREEFLGDDKPEAKPTSTEIPSWWGGDEPHWNAFEQYLSTLSSNAKADVIKEITEKSEKEQKAIDDATEYMDTEIASIQSDKKINPDGVKIDRNKLLKFVLDNEIVDTKGRWNYRVGYQLMKSGAKSVKKQTIEEKKKIAGASTSESGAETPKSKITTSEDFENPSNRPW